MTEYEEGGSNTIEQLKGYRQQNITISKDYTDDSEIKQKYEYLFSGISAKFSSMPVEKIGTEVEHALQMFIEVFNLDRSTLFSIAASKKQFVGSFSYAKQNRPTVKTMIGADLFPWTFQKLLRREFFSFGDISQLPEDANQDVQNFKAYQLSSGFIVPVLLNNEVKYAIAVGLIGKTVEKWPESMLVRAQILGEILANAIERYKYDLKLNKALDQSHRLKEQSEFDELIVSDAETRELEIIPTINKKRKNLDLWIKTGIKYFANTGKLELNQISKNVGLAKTSFYNIYPNLQENNGLERFKLDVFYYMEQKLHHVFDHCQMILKEGASTSAQNQMVNLLSDNQDCIKALSRIHLDTAEFNIKTIAMRIDQHLGRVFDLYLSKLTDRHPLPADEVEELKDSFKTKLYYKSLAESTHTFIQSLNKFFDNTRKKIKP